MERSEFDGILKTLDAVRHVLNLKKFFIFSHILDLKGYKYIGEDGVLKVSKGGHVIMKGGENVLIICLA